MVYTAKQGQTPFDVAVQWYGSLDYLFVLLEDNNISATVSFDHGDQLTIRDELTVKEELPVIANFYDEI